MIEIKYTKIIKDGYLCKGVIVVYRAETITRDSTPEERREGYAKTRSVFWLTEVLGIREIVVKTCRCAETTQQPCKCSLSAARKYVTENWPGETIA